MNYFLLMMACTEKENVEEEWVALPSIMAHQFDDFSDWATPIDDVIIVGEQEFGDGFSRAIHDLMPFGERLWIGYGDANVNLGGVVPITFRAFTNAQDPNPVFDRTSGEEQLTLFRILNDSLWMAGVDSLGSDEQVHFPLIGGNMYTYGDQEWSKHPSVPGGEHVHDVAQWQGRSWSVGSGANNRDEFEAGLVHRYLWRSLDNGESWMTVHREQNSKPGEADTRWIYLLPQADDLYLFGYEYNWVEGQITIVNSEFDGWSVHDVRSNSSLHNVFASGTLPISETVGLLWGVDANRSSLVNETWLVEDGEKTSLQPLEGRTLLDVILRPDTQEVLFLSYDGNEYGANLESWSVGIHLAQADALQDAQEILSWTTDVAPSSLAFFDGSLFLGMSDGRVLKASGVAN